MKSQKSKMKRISAMILSLALLLCAAVPAMAEAAKDETVYILSDAQGEARRIIVSDWLKNPDKLDELTDATRLSGMTVVEGNATFERDGERLTWDADGKDVYYQGDSDEELPLTLQITYLVDGEEVPAAHMAGKSGHVTIRFAYTPAAGQKAQFAALSAALLDSSKFTNVEVTNGAVINDGDRLLVLGVALPGLKERLDVEDKDGKLPETVEITADVEDFALPLTVTAASSEWSSLLKDMDLSLIDTADGDMDQLTDAMTQLLDGGRQLSEGTAALNDQTAALSDGVGQISGGLSTLSENSESLNAGALQVFELLLQTASQQLKALNPQVPDLTVDTYAAVLDQLTQQLTAAKQTQTEAFQSLQVLKAQLDGYNEFYTGLTAYTAGVDQLNAGAAQLNGSMPALTEGVGALNDGAAQLYAGLQTLDQDGLQTLTSMVNDEWKPLFEKARALADDTEAYQSYAGKADDAEGVVRFLWRTDAIGE